MATVSNVIWSLELSGYHQWTPVERDSVENFLRAHGIEPRDVPVDRFRSLFVRDAGDGSRELDVWVYERNENGRVEMCPHCPSCAKMRHVVTPVVADLPEVSWTIRPPTRS